ncbi:(2Fe-2S)-binding protein [uncultured Eudoraea sp.]|uniref:(2Fe-2S)-binding protein n=1 Tax=uncultured Eudoraea sp. TaxID=1035614 RepID=UPI002624CDC2|nr:(2Fe-2S)-binding protein [uncultured Eudoraea sp.]
MASQSLNINNKKYAVDLNEDTSLLWVLREHLGLTGTKYGCGIALCGSCTIHVDDKPMRACSLTLSALNKGQKITTIEGLSKNGDHPIQQAWVEAQAPQCGYCQSGQIMQAVTLLAENPNPTREEIKAYMNGNLCRCGTYLRIVKAIEIAAKKTSVKT